MNKGTVLIIEDEAIVAADLRSKLTQLGYEVVGVAATGEESVALARRLHPDLVLMDIWLQGTMDGIAAAEAIRADVDVPVVYLTAHSDAATLARAKLTGPFGYILKPFEERELVTQIELALYKFQTDREIRQQRELLKVTLASIGEAVIATNDAGLILYANPVAEQLTGWTAEEAMGQSVAHILHFVSEHTGDTIESPVERVLREGETVTLTAGTVLRRRTGAAVPVECNASPIRTAAGHVIGSVFAVRDDTLRRQAEQTLREANSRYELVMAGAKAAIWDWDVRQNKVLFSPQWKILRGMAAEDPSDSLDEWNRNIHPDDVDRVNAAIQAHFAGHTAVFTEEYRVRHKDGSWIWIHDRGLARRDDRGQVVRMAGSETDITERKQSEARLAQENREMALANRIIETFFKERSEIAVRNAAAALTAATDSERCEFGIVDECGMVVYPKAPAISASNVANKTNSDDDDGVWPAAKQVAPPSKQIVTQSKRMGDHVKHGLTVPIVFQDQVIGQWLLTKTNQPFSADDCLFLRGVSTRTAPILYAWLQKRMRERERKRAEDRWRLLAQITAQLLASDRPQRIVEYICRQVMEHIDCHMFLNVLVDDQSGYPLLDACAGIPEEIAQRIGAHEYYTALRHRPVCDGDRNVDGVIAADSNDRNDLLHGEGVRAYACHALVNQDHVIGALAFGSRTKSAFTEDELSLLKAVADHVAIAVQRLRLLTSLERSARAAGAASEAKSQFLAHMSHELRTPMNAILGMVDVALPKATHPTVQDCLQTVKSSADLLLTLLNDLLDSARIESGKMELESAPFRLRDVADHLTRVLSLRAAEKGLVFTCQFSNDLPDAVIGDRMRLQQILLNLAGNAIKFTERGEVTIRIHATTCDDLVNLEFAVADTGIGIPPAAMANLFQPFIQADATMARRFGGSGLGLAISKGLAQRMGGDLRVDSRLGEGSTFYLTIQLRRSYVPVESALVSPPKQLAAANRSLRILLAEDNPANRKLAQYILSDRGHVVDHAEDGAEAIRMAAHNAYDVILMDVQMPRVGGLEAAASIRQKERTDSRVPIIALTAHAMAGDRERCLAAGMDGYLSKPIDAHTFVKVVEGAAEHAMSRCSDPAAQSAPSCPCSHDAERVFDPHEALTRCLNNDTMLRSLIQSYLGEVDGLLSEMRAAASADELTTVGHLGHRVKGTVVYLGAREAAEAAARVERFCLESDGTVSDAQDAIVKLQAACHELTNALVRHRHSPDLP